MWANCLIGVPPDAWAILKNYGLHGLEFELYALAFCGSECVNFWRCSVMLAEGGPLI